MQPPPPARPRPPSEAASGWENSAAGGRPSSAPTPCSEDGSRDLPPLTASASGLSGGQPASASDLQRRGSPPPEEACSAGGPTALTHRRPSSAPSSTRQPFTHVPEGGSPSASPPSPLQPGQTSTGQASGGGANQARLSGLKAALLTQQPPKLACPQASPQGSSLHAASLILPCPPPPGSQWCCTHPEQTPRKDREALGMQVLGQSVPKPFVTACHQHGLPLHLQMGERQAPSEGPERSGGHSH